MPGDQALLGDPGHHAAKTLTDLFGAVFGLGGAHGLEPDLGGLVFQDPLTGKGATLNIGENLLHLGLGLVGDNTRAGDVVAIFRGIRDRIAHIGKAALIDQIDDQLDLMQALEIGHLGGIARLDQGIETGLDESAKTAAEHHLLAEEICFGLLLEAGLDDAAAPAADRCPIGKADIMAAPVASW